MFGRTELTTPAEVRRSAMGLLARREHSYTELLRKLLQRGASQDVAELELDRLQVDGLLSDARFCEAYVYSRSQRGYGPVRLREELRHRGVAESLIDDVLHDEVWSWIELADKVFAKRFPEGKAEDLKARARQQRFMQYRGFGGYWSS